jgi:hypothetical protein
VSFADSGRFWHTSARTRYTTSGLART